MYLFSFLPSVSRVLLSFTQAVGHSEIEEGGEKKREERSSEGERSVLIIEAGSADVPSSLSARILPLALFSVSFFSITSFLPQLVDLFFGLSVSVENTECFFCLVSHRRYLYDNKCINTAHINLQFHQSWLGDCICSNARFVHK